tara:strand:- start:1655 stop:2539 length:885 start_codon:yes stop_codon:yes gene_type:complete
MPDTDDSIELDVSEAAETEVEVSGDTSDSDDNYDNSEDQFSKAENSTQKRISRLTKKMREAERREQEAIKYAQAVQGESETLKSRMSKLDTSYVTEYTNRVNTQISQAEANLARAIDMGDSKATVEAQRALTSLAIQQDRATQAKSQSERSQQQQAAARQQEAAAREHQSRQPMPAQQPKRPDPKAEQWASRNEWFGSDEAMTYAAFGIHKKLVEDEGFDPQGEDYYTELDRRISSKFGGVAKNVERRPAQTVIGATRAPSARSSRKVRLTPSQVAIAKKLGVPLEEYAKYVKE